MINAQGFLWQAMVAQMPAEAPLQPLYLGIDGPAYA